MKYDMYGLSSLGGTVGLVKRTSYMQLCNILLDFNLTVKRLKQPGQPMVWRQRRECGADNSSGQYNSSCKQV